jgi:hypothetical protein
MHIKSYKCCGIQLGILQGILYKMPLIIVSMGEITSLALNAPNRASLRTTIPMFIVKQWELKVGDKLDWSLEARGKNQMVIVVRKSNTHNKKLN